MKGKKIVSGSKPDSKRTMNPRSLANLIPPKKGECRNPQGINRKRRWSDDIDLESDLPLSESEQGEKLRVALNLPADATWKMAGARLLVRQGILSKDLAWLREVMDRVEGTPARKMELSTPAGKHLRISVVYNRQPNREAIDNDRED